MKNASRKPGEKIKVFKNGLTGNVVKLLESEYEAYDGIIKKLVADYKPQTKTEKQLIERIADCQTLRTRLGTMGHSLIDAQLKILKTKVDPELAPARVDEWAVNQRMIQRILEVHPKLDRQLALYKDKLNRQ